VTDTRLTAREKEVLAYIVEGLTIQMIADKTGVTYNTMTSHFKHIYRKLEVHNRARAVAKALTEQFRRSGEGGR